MKNLNPLERDIERRVCEYARSLGCLAYKFVSPATSHVPDRIIITPNGVIAFVEFKRRGCVPTAAQAIEHAKMRKCKVLVFVVDSVEDGKNVVNSLLI
jgi:hypothetical protein